MDDKERADKAEAALAVAVAQTGWRGRGPNKDLYYCEGCGASHEDSDLIEHQDDCWVLTIRAGLSADCSKGDPIKGGNALENDAGLGKSHRPGSWGRWKAERDAAEKTRRKITALEIDLGEALAERDQARAEAAAAVAAAAVAAFDEYGWRHDPNCYWVRYTSAANRHCDCGLEEKRASIKDGTAAKALLDRLAYLERQCDHNADAFIQMWEYADKLRAENNKLRGLLAK